jgi:hypothetical protein
MIFNIFELIIKRINLVFDIYMIKSFIKNSLSCITLEVKVE